jgi:hypothetical protein
VFPVTVQVSDDLDGSAGSTVTLVSATGSPLPGGGSFGTSQDGSLQVAPLTVNAVAGQTFSGVLAVVYDHGANPAAGNLAAVIDWGDGTFINVLPVVQAGNGVFDVVGSHFYPVAGSGTVRILVQDIADGRTASAAAPLVVADASQPPPSSNPSPSQPPPATSGPPPSGSKGHGTIVSGPEQVSGYWTVRRGHPHQLVFHKAPIYRRWISYFVRV